MWSHGRLLVLAASLQLLGLAHPSSNNMLANNHLLKYRRSHDVSTTTFEFNGNVTLLSEPHPHPGAAPTKKKRCTNILLSFLPGACFGGLVVHISLNQSNELLANKYSGASSDKRQRSENFYDLRPEHIRRKQDAQELVRRKKRMEMETKQVQPQEKILSLNGFRPFSDVRFPDSATTITTTGEKRAWRRTKYTLDSFFVAGVNLAAYGFGDISKELNPATPFELYEDFNIGARIKGSEFWWILQSYKRHQGKDYPSLTFYVDKIAQKRWMPTIGYDVPKSFALRYKTELGKGVIESFASVQSEGEVERSGKNYDIEDIKHLMPTEKSFVAKASHFSAARSVTIVECCKRRRDGTLKARMNDGFGYNRLTEVFSLHKQDYRLQIAGRLLTDLNELDATDEDAQLRLTQGFLIEERFLSGEDTDDDTLPALEFKCFVIWSRLFACHYRRGNFNAGYYDRSGKLIYKKIGGASATSLPDYVVWDKVVSIAERRAAHMDQLRVDIYVGRGSDDDKSDPIRYVISEVEMEQTSKFDPDLMDEATRLWIAGYRMNVFKVVPNTEVPKVYLENGLRLPANYTEVCSKDRSHDLCKTQ